LSRNQELFQENDKYLKGVIHFMEILDNIMSYMIGLIQTDGNLYEQTRNRGRMAIELNIKDRDIIDKLVPHIMCNYRLNERQRLTNFGKSQTITLIVYDKNFRSYIKKCGVPSGKKSTVIAPPQNVSYVEVDYIRGLYDGDGSLGITRKGKAFISLTTASEELKEYIVHYVSNFLQKAPKKLQRNTRDNLYNIVLTNEDAVLFTQHLYYNGCLALKRKLEKASEVASWKRLSNTKVRTWKFQKWSSEEDQYILTHTIQESVERLSRTRQSIVLRRWRLRKM